MGVTLPRQDQPRAEPLEALHSLGAAERPHAMSAKDPPHQPPRAHTRPMRGPPPPPRTTTRGRPTHAQKEHERKRRPPSDIACHTHTPCELPARLVALLLVSLVCGFKMPSGSGDFSPPLHLMLATAAADHQTRELAPASEETRNVIKTKYRYYRYFYY